MTPSRAEGDASETPDAAAWFAAVVDGSDDAIIGKDLAGTIRSWNKGAERIYGYTPEEMIGTSILRLIPADRLAEEDFILGRITRGESVEHFETRRLTKDGRLIDVSVTASPIRGANGKVIGASKIARDVTMAKVRERELGRLSRCYAALSQVNQAIVMTTSREDLLPKACRALVDFGEFPLAWIGFVDPATARVNPAAVAGAQSDYVREALIYADERPEGRGPVGVCVRENRPVICNDVLIDEAALTWREELSERGLRAVGAFPIHHGGRTYGALCVYSTEPNCLQDKEVALLAEAAGDISFALDNFERRQAETRYRTLFEYAPDGILIADADSVYLDANPAMCRMLGYTHAELVGKSARDIVVEEGENRIAQALTSIHGGAPYRREWRFKRKDGSTFPADVFTTMMPDGCLMGMIRDITDRVHATAALRRSMIERENLIEQLGQSQKMESVGRLAGGVAHDFNNILTAISGYTELVLQSLPAGDERGADLKEVLASSQRASRLTTQLLAFSRKQILDPQVLELTSVISGIAQMLSRLIGENIKLETPSAAGPCLVKVDAGQIEQVLLNLAVNARDAMPQGGALSFAIDLIPAQEAASLSRLGLSPGPLVRLSVRDTGTGIPDSIKPHIFEPFFTTKEKGKGTGLGLSTVFGIIKQSGGEIEVESAPGRGTAFRIYLPQADERSADAGKHADKDLVLRGNETILLVEDEAPLRRLLERAIAAYGYQVQSAPDGEAALALLKGQGKPVDLLITDVVMPGMSGRDLARAVAGLKLARRTLFISGYAEDAIVDRGILEPGLALLAKPFSPDALLRKIRDVLDGSVDQAKA